MKIQKIKTFLALGISAAAMFVAATSSTMCYGRYYEEVKMPESLYKID
jgi:hypothetical protein